MSAMAWKRAAEAAEIVSRTVEGDLRRCGRAELAARARRLARALAAAGTARGDRVATLAWNGHRHVELALAAAEIGATLHALDPGEHSDGIARRAEAAGFRAVAFDLSFMPLVEDVAPRLAPDLAWIALTDRANMPGPGEAPNLLCYEDVLAGAPAGTARGEIARSPSRPTRTACPPPRTGRARRGSIRATRCSPPSRCSAPTGGSWRAPPGTRAPGWCCPAPGSTPGRFMT